MRSDWCWGFVLLLGVLGCDSGKSSDGADAGHTPVAGGGWDCTGSHGKPLSCDSPLARPVTGAKYDSKRNCFDARKLLQGYCAVPTYCLGSSGELVCVVDPSGDAYGVYLFYGEEFTTNSDWHHSGGMVIQSTLTDAEAERCRSILDAYAGPIDSSDGGVAEERQLTVESSSAQVSPICD